MGKTRIAILGGGMAGLTCAHELSRTPELRARYEVTVYQMGWRLGGKAASGRDHRGRNLEHGLHVWFGYYENAFRLLREVYDARAPNPDCPLRTWRDAFKPQAHTAIGVRIGSRWDYVCVNWPDNHGEPGDGRPVSTLWRALTLVWGLAVDLLRQTPARANAPDIAHEALDRPLFSAALRLGRSAGDPHRAIHLSDGRPLAPAHAVEAALHWLEALAEKAVETPWLHLHALSRLISAVEHAFVHPDGLASDDAARRLTAETLHIFFAALRGARIDLLQPDRPFEAIDDVDFRAWLVRHGARPEVAESSSIVRVVYDISFQYTDGCLDKPDCAAGSALGSIIRMLATYKGAMMYLAQAGFGETVVAPIYEALRQAGVEFRFFRKVVALELSDDRRSVDRIRLHRQADIVSGRAYDPTIEVGGLTCWPARPRWGQLEDGAALETAGVDFESRWCAHPPAGEETLRAGRDFDHVVLAVAMGAYKPLTDRSGDHDPGFCRELAAANAGFRRFLTIPLSPTLSAQVWSDRTLAELGWSTGKCATVSGPQPFNIWADMTQVLATEPDGPKSLHYFCGAYATDFHTASPCRSEVPALADEEVKQAAKAWLTAQSGALWPSAHPAAGFDWTMLSDDEGRVGEARFEAQYWRANIDPTECCVASATGSTIHRLLPDESGFDNLTLTGEGTRHGLNATAVEAAVMSGMAAARAVRRMPTDDIPGFDFLRRRPRESPWGIE
jgi:uncharacterized protein with NAD-binding domain and iron-sulfur cluster